jgi:hypothetical protein
MEIVIDDVNNQRIKAIYGLQTHNLIRVRVQWEISEWKEINRNGRQVCNISYYTLCIWTK